LSLYDGQLEWHCGKLGWNLQYTVFRNAIVGEMAKDGYQPDEMDTVMCRVTGA